MTVHIVHSVLPIPQPHFSSHYSYSQEVKPRWGHWSSGTLRVPQGPPPFLHQLCTWLCSLRLPLFQMLLGYISWLILVSASGDLWQVWQTLQFRVYGFFVCPVDSAGLLLSRAYPVSEGFHLLPVSAYFFSLCTLAIPASTMLNLLTQTDAEGASIIIFIEML